MATALVLVLAGTATAGVIGYNLTLSSGTTALHCRGQGEHWNAKGYPLTVYCPPVGSSTTSVATTTTVVPTTTTTEPSTTTSTSTTTSSTTTSSTTSTTVPATGTTPASFLPKSMFNQPVTGNAVLSDSATLVASLVAQYESAYGSIGVNFNRPVYEATASTPDVSMSVASGCNSFTSDTGTEVPIPAGATAGDSSDEILTVYQPSSETEWEFWLASKTSTGWQACWGGKLDMATSDGVFPAPYGETATGISNLATEITSQDLASGSIDHAIAMEILGDNCNGYVAPADRGDCGSHSGNPSEGTWFRFAPGTPMPSGLSPFAQMVFQAGLKYGFVVVDQGGAVMLEADEASGNSSTLDGQAEYHVVKSLPWSDLQAITPAQG